MLYSSGSTILFKKVGYLWFYHFCKGFCLNAPPHQQSERDQYRLTAAHSITMGDCVNKAQFSSVIDKVNGENMLANKEPYPPDLLQTALSY